VGQDAHMSGLLTYELGDGVATITVDDGKVNALSPAMLGEIGTALDRADADGAVVLLTGRPGMFSAGFDLRVLGAGGAGAAEMLRAGFELSYRLLSFPAPVVIACSGHALAMAVFLVLSGDYRLGADGAFRIGANEVAIGLTMPRAAIEVCRQRLAPAHFHRAVNNAEIYTPAAAVAAGFLDEVVAPEDLAARARERALALGALDRAAHRATKLRARHGALEALRAAIGTDDAEVRALMGVTA